MQNGGSLSAPERIWRVRATAAVARDAASPLTNAAVPIERAGRDRFVNRADQALAAHIPGWAKSPVADRRAFVVLCLQRSSRYGMRHEASVMAYVLGAVWLGIDFEEVSALLRDVLNSGLPEARKSHAMSEWIGDRLRAAATAQSGDATIRRSFLTTSPAGYV